MLSSIAMNHPPVPLQEQFPRNPDNDQFSIENAHEKVSCNSDHDNLSQTASSIQNINNETVAVTNAHDDNTMISDPMLLEDLMSQLFSFDTIPDLHLHTISVVSTCSSLGSTYAYIVPQILSRYEHLSHTNPIHSKLKDTCANVVHVIPQHKTIKAEISDNDSRQHSMTSTASTVTSNPGYSSFYSQNSLDTASAYGRNSVYTANGQSLFNACSLESAFNGMNEIPDSTMNFSISPRNLNLFQPTSTNDFSQSNYSYSQNTNINRSASGPSCRRPSAYRSLSSHDSPINDDIARIFTAHTPPSPLLSPIVSLFPFSQPTPIQPEEQDQLQDRIFNTFAFMPINTKSLVVPPNSTQYNFALYPLPSHVLPSFKDIIKARFSETSPSGLMVVCYPTSLSLYKNFILPCLDLALHRMLALNMISTQACEAITVPPCSKVYTFEQQMALINQLENIDIVYSRNIKNYSPSDWGYRWLSEDMLWIRQTLQSLDVNSQSILKLINTMTKSNLWNVSAVCDISLFIVRKNPPS